MKRHAAYRTIMYVSVALMLLLSAPMVAAQQSTPAKEGVAVQLNPIAVTAVTKNGYTGRSVVTPYLKVIDAEALARLCSRLPRLTEIILIAFNETPAVLENLAEHMEARQPEFRTRIESVIGTGVFRGFYIVEGAAKRGEGTETAIVEGGTRSCQPLKQLPWEVAGGSKSGQSAENDSDSSEPRSPLSEAQLAAAEAELLAEQPPRGAFPDEPVLPSGPTPPWVLVGIVLFGLSGIMILAGSYIGYQVAKIRRERRRRERRKMRKERRSQTDRRQKQIDMPEGADRRKGAERRITPDRRQAIDRREKTDRRDKE